MGQVPEDTGVSLQVSAPTEIRVGQRVALRIALALPVHAASPVLLTQAAAGEAVEVLRGRLSRSDARRGREGELEFELPVLARAAGTSIVRVHALAYLCEERCVAVEREARVSVLVLK